MKSLRDVIPPLSMTKEVGGAAEAAHFQINRDCFRRRRMEMQGWEQFENLKQRGEWAELQFMAAAAGRCFTVCKPWGDTAGFDVGVEYPPNFLRVQVKSSACRIGKGDWGQFT